MLNGSNDVFCMSVVCPHWIWPKMKFLFSVIRKERKMWKLGGLGLEVIQGHRQCHHSIERTRLPYPSILYLFRVIASYLFKKSFILTYPTWIWCHCWVTQFEFRRDFWRQKARVPWLSCSVVCVIPRLAVLTQYRRVTDSQTGTHRHTTTACTALALRRAAR